MRPALLFVLVPALFGACSSTANQSDLSTSARDGGAADGNHAEAGEDKDEAAAPDAKGPSSSDGGPASCAPSPNTSAACAKGADPARWTPATLGATDESALPLTPQVVVDVSGTVHAAWISGAGSETVEYASNATGTFVVKPVSMTPATRVLDVALAVDGCGQPTVAYVRKAGDTNAGSVHVATLTNGKWIDDAPPGVPDDVASAALAVSPAGDVHVVLDRALATTTQNDLASRVGGAWKIETLPERSWGPTSIALRPTGSPVIAYEDYALARPMLAKKTGATWSSVEIADAEVSEAFSARWIDVKVDSNGDEHVVWLAKSGSADAGLGTPLLHAVRASGSASFGSVATIDLVYSVLSFAFSLPAAVTYTAWTDATSVFDVYARTSRRNSAGWSSPQDATGYGDHVTGVGGAVDAKGRSWIVGRRGVGATATEDLWAQNCNP
jgi:hypothetical protein